MRHRLATLLAGLALAGGLFVPCAQAATATRTSAFEYDPASGLLNKEIIEPDNPNLCLVTTYSLDDYGNKTGSTTRNCNGSSGEAAAPTGDSVFQARTSTTSYAATAANPFAGQFPTSSANALGHTETKEFDPRTGKVTKLTGPNGLTTTWAYDGFGRKVLETRSDATTTAWNYLECDSTCPSYAKYYVQTVSSGAPESRVYYDMHNREIRNATVGFDGRWVYKDTEYNDLGLVHRVSRPYYSGDPAYWTTSAYDELGRPYHIQDDSENPPATTTISYFHFTTITTNPKGQTKTEVKNSQGQLVSVTDAAGFVIAYAYDPFGNLTRTTDPNGNQIVNSYDPRGRKTAMADPDMGNWTYVYNALGELVRQTDANGRSVTNTYDLLGRLTRRAEADLITNWYYDKYKDNSPCAVGTGKLCEISSDNNMGQKIYYEGYGGRISVIAHTIDLPANPYMAYRYYDAQGRVESQSVNANGGVFSTFNVYNTYGYLSEVRQGSQTGPMLWRADLMDAEGHVTRETLGNGVTSDHIYNAQNGRLTGIQANGPNGSVQNQSYDYDPLGNLETRSDAHLSSNESFLYDSLNRLTSATRNGATVTVQYDALGNITNKSDVGAYSYGRPHAVSQAGANTYTYDANGNALTGAGRTMSWTSYNLPYQIVETLNGTPTTTTFLYDYNHVRAKQTTGAKTVIYLNPRIDLGGHYNKEIVGGVVTESFYFYAGGKVVGAYVTKTGTPAQTNYFHGDHLGSISVVTDQAGQVVTRYQYDAWGKRVLASGSNATIHGFTGHEHLEDGLIHMNGRVYDPVLARFLSADPNIQDAGNLQSYNRYSYVLNNPLAFTDPSGYFSLKKLFKVVVSIAIAVYAPQFLAQQFGMDIVAAKFAGGFLAGAVGSGNMQGGVMGMLSAGMFMGIHTAIPDWGLAKIVAHGIAGGIMSEMQGGEFGSGFLSGGFTQAFAPTIDGIDSATVGPSLQRTIAAAVVGGTGSAIGGGKFSNGAMTGAFSRLFNDDLSNGRKDYSIYNRLVSWISPSDTTGWPALFGPDRGPSTLEVWAHGNSARVAGMDAKQLSGELSATGKMSGIDTVKFYVCNAGAGDNSIAQQFSMLNPNLTVVAADGRLFNFLSIQFSQPYHDYVELPFGQYRPDYSTSGGWRYFKAGGEIK